MLTVFSKGSCSAVENRYLTGETKRKVIHGLCKLPAVKMDNEKILLKDGQIFYIGGIKIECILVGFLRQD